jgi:hypothetical protein
MCRHSSGMESRLENHIAQRLAQIQGHSLKSGSHDPNEPNGHFDACVMEAVAYVAGEPWSDAPSCACPVITAFMVSWNDSLPSDADRDRLLKPLIPIIVGTRSTPAVEQRRATMAADWLVRIYTPAWLRAAKLGKQAELLEALPEITDFAQCPSLMPVLEAVRTDAAAARDAAWAAVWAAVWAAAWDAARDAARAAAWDAAWAAVWDAARDAAWAAARDAAWAAVWAAARAAAWDAARAAARAAAWDAARDAARDAAWAAVWAAARAAAWDAAWDAAGAALAPTVARLQDSAVDLVKRMCEIKEAA